MPSLISFAGNWLVPQTYNMFDFVLPRVNLCSLWFLKLSILISLNAMLREEGVSSGWTLYVPLSDASYNSSSSISIFIFCIHLLGLSSQGGSLTFLCSMLVAKSHGLMQSRSTLFTWCIGVVSVLLITTLPVLGAGATTILLDRIANTGMLNPSLGGDPILFQHMFWFFGHPEVYVIILPAFGIISLSISENTTRSSFGYTAMLWAILSIAFIGYFVWAHHMFSTGMSLDSRLYFSSATAIIAVPTAVKIYSWLVSSTAEVFSQHNILKVSFLLCFTTGGFTGLILSNSGIDLLYHDTYYVIAHFHYVLSIGALFACIIVVRMFIQSILPYSHEVSLASYNDANVVIGVNVLFLLLHELGRDGHPRRIPVSTEISLLSSTIANAGLLIIICSLLQFTAHGKLPSRSSSHIILAN